MPHAELDPQIRDLLVAVFAGDYNALHASSIVFDQETPADDPSCDYQFRDTGSGGTLKVQLTRAAGEGASIDEERVRPDTIAKHFIAPLRDALTAFRPAGYVVSVLVDGQFPSKDSARMIARMTAQAVMSALRREPHSSSSLVAEFDRDDIDQLYRPISSFVANLEVRKADSGQPLIVSWSPSRSETVWNGRLAPRALLAAEKKAHALGSGAKDLALLVWSDLWPVDGLYVEEVKTQLTGRAWPFLEIWLLDCWGDGSGSAHKVWSRDSSKL